MGVREARGEVVLLLDDDMEPQPACLAAHHAAHAPGRRLGVLGAVPVRLGPDAPPVVQYVGTKFNRHLEKLSRPGHVISIRDFYTGHFSIRRDLLLEVGAFDEDFALYGNEDVELAVRLRSAGVSLCYFPKAVAVQHYEKDFAALARDNVEKGRTAVLCARKHPEAFAGLRLSQYGKGSRKWRAARALLLATSRVAPATPRAVARLVGWLERRRPARLAVYYTLALDYFYWVGARAALAQDPLAGRGSSLAVSAP
jgi:GT2 family glycosyltransferase